jgi:pimeloyl-ACP methyl ester carboxylesterase
VYRTRQDLGEGYGASFPRHRGLYQPYAIYVPTSYDASAPAPLAIVMHSLNNIHNEYDTELVYEQIAEDRGAVAITPLALGVDGWYWDRALVDTLDAWTDVRRHYAIDDRQTTVSGYSMGGYGSWRLATLLPDRIAAAAVWAGVPAYQIWAFPAPPVGSPLSRTGPGNTNDQLENTRQIPFMVSHGVNDELVPIAGVTWQTDRLHRLGHSYRYHVHPGYGHGSFRTLNDYTRERGWLTGRSRVDDPGRVTYKVRPESWVTPGIDSAEAQSILALLDELAAELGGNLRSAYWVEGVQVSDGAGAIGTVDLTSDGRAETSSTVEHADVRMTPSNHVLRGLDRTDTPVATANRLRGSLQGVTELTVDLTRAGLTLDGLDLAVTSDRITTLHLREGSTTHTVTLQPAGPLG